MADSRRTRNANKLTSKNGVFFNQIGVNLTVPASFEHHSGLNTLRFSAERLIRKIVVFHADVVIMKDKVFRNLFFPRGIIEKKGASPIA